MAAWSHRRSTAAPSSASSSSSTQRKAALLAGLFCIARICVASPLNEQQQQQVAFNADPQQDQGAEYSDTIPIAGHGLTTSLASSSSSSSSSEVNLHRMCIPSSYSSYWTTSVLPALEALASRHSDLPLDIWRYPYRTSKKHHAAHELEDEDEECIDFTYPSSVAAEDEIENVERFLPQEAELRWQLLADDKELARRIDRQRSQSLTAEATEAMKEAEEEEKNVAIAGRKARKGKGRKAKGGRKDKQTKIVDDHFHNGYHALENITSFLSYQASQRPQVIELVDMGLTYENRTIQAVRLGKKHGRHGRPKKEIVITAGSHGREWVTTSTSLYLLSALLEPSSAPLLETFSVLIIPTLNPDGYAYTWTSDRFFRKNRQLVSANRDWLGRKCYGLDIARSFPANFRAAQPGSCGPTYAGTAPLQSAESQALASYLRNETNEVIAYVDLHSYGQLLLYPWMSCRPSSGDGPDMPDEEDLSELALGAAREGRYAHNKAYRAGRGCQTMYNQDGSSVDFAHEEARIKWSFEVELRDEGSYGFTLPPEMIRPTGEESWRMVRYLMRFVKEKEKL